MTQFNESASNEIEEVRRVFRESRCLEPKIWLTLEEAAEYSGLPSGYLAHRAYFLRATIHVLNVGDDEEPRWMFNRDGLNDLV